MICYAFSSSINWMCVEDPFSQIQSQMCLIVLQYMKVWLWYVAASGDLLKLYSVAH